MAAIPSIPLASSAEKKFAIPSLAFGTAEFPFGTQPDTVKRAVLNAIKLGYRHFDTASVYQSEQPLGEAIAEALRLGLIESRDQVFVTSKLWCSDTHPDRVLPALQKTLQNLKLDYIDLYLMHWPASLKPGLTVGITKDDILPVDLNSVWKAMEECQNLGLTKSIGVSNFSRKKLDTILEIAKIPPSVNQVEMHPLWQQNKLRKFCKEKGILVAGYSPLGATGTLWGTKGVMESLVLKEIADGKGKSVAQVCLRWGHQLGVCVVVKSFNEERMKENLEIFDWELSEEEIEKISGISPQCKGIKGEFLVSPNGPYKSLEELWDGEI